MRAAGASHKLIVSMQFSRHFPSPYINIYLPSLFVESKTNIPLRSVSWRSATGSIDRSKSTLRAKTVGPNCSRSLSWGTETRGSLLALTSDNRRGGLETRPQTSLVFFPPGNGGRHVSHEVIIALPRFKNLGQFSLRPGINGNEVARWTRT